MSPRALAVTVNQGKGNVRDELLSTWRCCCCPATGRALNANAALESHWAHGCPGIASIEQKDET